MVTPSDCEDAQDSLPILVTATLSEDERLDALGRLLTGSDIPMRLRIAGIIVLLYAQPLTRVVRFTIDDVPHDGETTLLRLGKPASPSPRRSRPCSRSTSPAAPA